MSEVNGGTVCSAQKTNAKTTHYFALNGVNLWQNTEGPGTYTFLSDGLGNIRGLHQNGQPNPVQYVYDGYGVTGLYVNTPAPPQAAANTKGNKGKNGNSASPNNGASAPGVPHYSTFGYRGQLTDKTGLQFLRHRYYDPATGVFLTQDPAQYGINWYGYAGGDPVNRWDPSGLVDLTRYTPEQLAQKRQAEIWAFQGMGEAIVDTATFAGKFFTPAVIYFGPTEGPEMAKNIGTGLWKTTELVAPFLGPGVPMFGHHTTESLRAHQEAQRRSAAVVSALWSQFATKMKDPEYANRLAGYVTMQVGIDILSGVAIAKFVKYLDELDELAATAKLFDKLDDAPGSVAPKSSGYPTKTLNGRTYELRPSNDGTGPNRWHRVKPATTAGRQNHHLISNPIVDALEEHARISRETGLALRKNPALQKLSAPGGHVGYENWHRAYDRHMVDWIEEQGTDLKITEFFDEINRYYQSGDAATRIPDVNLGTPQ